MSMEQTPGDPQHGFEALRRLIALKQYEVPPPRFFDELPARIMSRIDVDPPGTWERLLEHLSSKPWFQPLAAAAMAVLVGTLFLSALESGDHGRQSATSAFLLQAPSSGPSLQPVLPGDSAAPSLQPTEPLLGRP